MSLMLKQSPKLVAAPHSIHPKRARNAVDGIPPPNSDGYRDMPEVEEYRTSVLMAQPDLWRVRRIQLYIVAAVFVVAAWWAVNSQSDYRLPAIAASMIGLAWAAYELLFKNYPSVISDETYTAAEQRLTLIGDMRKAINPMWVLAVLFFLALDGIFLASAFIPALAETLTPEDLKWVYLAGVVVVAGGLGLAIKEAAEEGQGEEMHRRLRSFRSDNPSHAETCAQQLHPHVHQRGYEESYPKIKRRLLVLTVVSLVFISTGMRILDAKGVTHQTVQLPAASTGHSVSLGVGDIALPDDPLPPLPPADADPVPPSPDVPEESGNDSRVIKVVFISMGLALFLTLSTFALYHNLKKHVALSRTGDDDRLIISRFNSVEELRQFYTAFEARQRKVLQDDLAKFGREFMKELHAMDPHRAKHWPKWQTPKAGTLIH